MYADGQKVAFSGDPHEGSPDVGDEGVIVAVGHTASHVKWETGQRAGQFIEMSHYDLTVLSAARDHDLMASGLVSFSVRDVCASQGVRGLLARLAQEGHTANFEDIAVQAVQDTGSLIRSAPSMAEVIANLDSHDAEELVSMAAVALLRDAFGQGGE